MGIPFQGLLNISLLWQAKRRQPLSAGGNVQKSPSSKAANRWRGPAGPLRRAERKVREHGKMARTPLNFPFRYEEGLNLGTKTYGKSSPSCCQCSVKIDVLRRKGTAAATGGFGLWIFDGETRSLKAVHIVHFGATQHRSAL